MQTNRIEKRIPFGFHGDWGTLYKKYVYDTENVIVYKKTNYYDIGMDVQFKALDDGIVKRTTTNDEKVDKKRQKESYRIVQTTDAFFNDETGEYECIVEVGDIIKVFGRFWVVENIEEECIYSPVKQSFFNINVTKIAKEEIII